MSRPRSRRHHHRRQQVRLGVDQQHLQRALVVQYFRVAVESAVV